MVPKRGWWRGLILGCAVQAGCGHTSHDDRAVEAHGITFDEYVASLPYDEGLGAYVVEGDILVYDRSELTDYYAAYLYGTALTLDQTSTGVDNKWSAAEARDLTYCVSDDFGADKTLVRDTFALAAQDWMDATKISSGDEPTIRFRYLSGEDADCTPFNNDVVFNISPTTSNKFDAGSFRPNYSRGKRQLLITPGAIEAYKQRTFLGVLRHEIGHMLGFRHEHINTPGTPCPETDFPNWRPITEYDVPSVMHYRNVATGRCANASVTDYTMTTLDNAAVRCVYTTQARAAADQAGDACRALTSYSPSAKSFVIDGDGTLYRLTQSTTSNERLSIVARYVAPGTTSKQSWRTLWRATEPTASATSAIFAGGSELYRRTATELYRWDGDSWSTIQGGPGNSIVVAYSSGDLFRLNSTGTIDRVIAGSGDVTRVLTSAVAGRKLFPGTTELYRVESNGDSYVWAAGTWSSRIGTGIRAIAKTEAGATFCLLDDAAGTVMLRKSGGAWSAIGSGARALWGGLEVPYVSRKDDPSTSRDESSIIRRNPSGSTWRSYTLSSTRIMKGGNRRIAINTNGRPYAYATP